MEKVAAASSPLGDVAMYDSWEEVNVLTDQGKREVHYYLKRKEGASDLAVLGKEKSLKHISYRLAVRDLAVSTSLMAFGKLKCRGDVIDWLNSVVSDSSGDQSLKTGQICNGGYSGSLGLENFKELGTYTRDFSWLGSPWIGRRRRKHYLSFRRNGVEISVHDFVYVLAEKGKRLVAYLEDMYEDSKGNRMVVVRWFHKTDEVGIVLPHTYSDREIFFSLCLQDFSIECIDGLATVLSPQHFKKFLNLGLYSQQEPFMCEMLFENDCVKSFDITKIKGYWKQDIVRYLSSAATLNVPSDDQKVDVNDDVRVRPRKRHCQSKADGVLMHNSKRIGSLDVSCDDQDPGNSSIDCRTGTDTCRQDSRFPLLGEETKQFSSQHLRKGSKIEVLSQDSGIRWCWFSAFIVKKHKDKVKIQYQDIHDAVDESKRLEEWISASRAADPDQLGVRMRNRSTIRPSPDQFQSKVPPVVNIGTFVDVWWHDGWWEGIVIKKDSEDKYLVYLPGENQEAIFGPNDVRYSQEWVGNCWISIKQRPDLVSGILARLNKQQDTLEPVVSNSAHTGTSDSRQDAGSSDSNSDSGNEAATNTVQFPDLSKDDLLSQLKWKSSRKRRRCNAISAQKLNASLIHCNSAKEDAECQRFTIRTPLTIDIENCKYLGDSLFNSSVVPSLTNLVMSR